VPPHVCKVHAPSCGKSLLKYCCEQHNCCNRAQGACTELIERAARGKAALAAAFSAAAANASRGGGRRESRAAAVMLSRIQQG